jgi:hypothetical protein
MILIKALNVSTVAEALQQQLQEWPYMAANNVKVTRAAVLNKSQSDCPWIGIYRQGQSFEPRTLGLGNGYRRQNITFALVLQASSLKGGEDCELLMESLLSEAVSAICSDESIRGTCDCLSPDPFNITYSSYSAEGTSFYQEAVLIFTVVTNVTAQEA